MRIRSASLRPSLAVSHVGKSLTRWSASIARHRSVRHSFEQSAQLSDQETWDATTDRLVSFSAIPFSVLVLPQVVQNAVNMLNGQAASLSIISWEVCIWLMV